MIDHPTRLEIAFGADPAGDPDDWTWTEVPQDRWGDQTIQIRRGRADESAEAGPSQVSFTVDNRSGDYTPDDPRSPHWPNVRRGTPVRFLARLDRDDGAFSSAFSSDFDHGDWRVRFVGQCSEWVPDWPEGDISDHDDPVNRPGEATVTLVCNGILRRLGQGARPLESAMYRLFSTDAAVVAYWPLEDGAIVQAPASPLPGVPSGRARGDISWGQDATLVGSRGLPQIEDGQHGNFVVRTPSVSRYDPAEPWTVSVVCKVTRANPARVLTVRTTNGSYIVAKLSSTELVVEGNIVFTTGSDAGYVEMPFSDDVAADLAGRWVRVAVRISPTPLFITSVDWAATVTPVGETDPVASLSGSEDFGPYQPPFPAGITVGPLVKTAGTFSFGHLAITEGDPDPSADLGWDGEPAGTRIARLCVEENVDLDLQGDPDDTTLMGPQVSGVALLPLLAEFAAADLGLLGEQIDRPGLTYRTRLSRYNVPPAIVLDAVANEIEAPFAPTLDDQRLRNDITVTRQGGASYRAADETSIDDEGTYDEQVTVNLHEDRQAHDHAWWRLRTGTWPGLRYPSVASNLTPGPDGRASAPEWLNAVVGDRVTVANLPPQHPDRDVDVVVEGTTETITPVSWGIEAACSPAGIWDVAELTDVLPSGEPGALVLSDHYARSDRVLDDRADTGQPYHPAAIYPIGTVTPSSMRLRIVDGKVDLPGPGAGYDWLYQDTDEVRLRFEFGPGTIRPEQEDPYWSEDGPMPLSGLAIIISKVRTWDHPVDVAIRSIHTVVTPLVAGVWFLNGVFIPHVTEPDDLELFLAPGPVFDPLDFDTPYEIVMRIDREAETLRIIYPNGTDRTLGPNPLIPALWGGSVLIEILREEATFDTDPVPYITGLDGWGETGELFRLDSGGSTLTSGIDADDTSVSVTVDGPLWTDDDAPFRVTIDGEDMTVTAISGAGPQTFTVERSDTARAHPAGAEVHVTAPVLAL